MPIPALATVIHLELTALVYLVFAVPPAIALTAATRRPVVSSLGVSVLAMVVTAALKAHLPFDYWAHANDFIIELFLQGKILERPIEGLLSLVFHLGVPLGVVLLFRRLTGIGRKPG